ncbi:MAG: hypothetical protein QM496_18065 [Verrucomicrobiota bacterium]
MVKRWVTCWYLALIGIAAQAGEDEYYQLRPYPLPTGLKMEASGLAVLPDGRLAVAIRKGEVWILQNPSESSEDVKKYQWKRFASGLHEPLGLTWHDGALYTTQRSEVTRLEDSDGDGVADAYLTAAKGWGVSGNYHEYAYGPVFDPKGNLWVTLNINIGKGQKIAGFKGAENHQWRGWSMRQKPGGKLEPISAGFRSPFGLGTNAAGDVFATDQQGNWWAAGPLIHLRKGVFHGHQDSLRDADRPQSPLKGAAVKPPKNITTAQAMKQVKAYVPPAVWFPYNKMGNSTTGIRCDRTGGKFGPFEDQLFIGEFTMSFISRVFLEKVKGEYQGACFHFRKGMQSAVLQMEYLPDGSMVIGESNRGWNSLGTRSYGLERLTWTGKMPFEIKKMEAQPQGFRLTFTKPVEAKSAADVKSYAMISYTYPYQQAYGGDELETQQVEIVNAKVSSDGMSVMLQCAGLRAGYVHELHAEGVKAKGGSAGLLHPEAFYTLNAIPE